MNQKICSDWSIIGLLGATNFVKVTIQEHFEWPLESFTISLEIGHNEIREGCKSNLVSISGSKIQI